jgi:amidase
VLKLKRHNAITTMIMLKDYIKYDALGLAELVKQKQVTPLELLHSAIDRAEKVNPAINAIITPLYEQAAETCKTSFPDGPFQGVPFLTKDHLLEVENTPLSNGSAAFKHNISNHDSELVSQYKSGGLNIFGKTNTPEFGLMGVTEPKEFGACRNPWDLTRTPGGSSGGSAAAVAAGIVPMASAGDGGGSIRIPASCCGLFGFKPSRGRTPLGPLATEYWDGAVVEHVLSRSVRDSAAALDLSSSPADVISSYTQFTSPIAHKLNETLPVSFLAALDQAPRKLKIAFSTQSPLGNPIEQEAKDAVQEAAKLLQSLGHDVVDAPPSYDGEAVAKSYFTLYMGHVAADINALCTESNSCIKEAPLELQTRTLGGLGRALSAEAFVSAKRRWHEYSVSMAKFHQEYDIYLTPVLAAKPAKIGEFDTSWIENLGMSVINYLGLHKLLLKSGQFEKTALKMLEKMPFTQLNNLTGQPGMSVPLHWTKDGIPMGVQFTSAFGDDCTLFQLARQLEQAKPWFDRTPSL